MTAELLDKIRLCKASQNRFEHNGKVKDRLSETLSSRLL